MTQPPDEQTRRDKQANRLLIVHPWCGAHERRRLYKEAATQSGWSIGVLTAERWRDEYGHVIKAAAGRDGAITLFTVPMWLTRSIPLHVHARSLYPALREFQPTQVYIYHEPYGLATAQVLAQVKRWRNIPVGVRSSQNITKTYPSPIRQLERYVYDRSDYCIAVSETVRDVLRAKGYQKPVHVIPMAIAKASARSSKCQRSAAGEALRVGFVGRLVEEKGAHLAIKAVAALPPGSARLTIVGDGPMRSRLAALGDACPNLVELIGALGPQETRALYASFDVVVVPSMRTRRWAEQFGRVVVEAATAGVPAVVSDSGELPELLRTLGAGWIVPEGEVAPITATLRGVLENREELMREGQRARHAAQMLYSEEAVAASLTEVFGQYAK